ncbi:restriction endonuclease [Methylobacterium sp. V23]|uniref:nSTAND3 domain-containing NTPase n=1 Tax=Methylobacterium sp. V23 TaxID=2044878 RepID=UPI0011B0484F|nr:restriction endonuclease [Methylobacterium sp. V23]
MPIRKRQINEPQATGPWADLALYSIGWRAFQDLCSQICDEVFKQPVQIYREAQDGGQDAVFIAATPSGPKDATIQCKHSSDQHRRLKVGDLTKELITVKELVSKQQADNYIILTSMSVDAPVAAALRDKLRKAGVIKPRVFGKEFIVRAIRYNSKLRALVPQVYGLGDLSTILDKRLFDQTRALIETWVPKLKLYVPTKSNRSAVQSLTKNGIVLLVGNPSSGKSTIGAILSTIATGGSDHGIYYLTSPRDFETSWNPHDKKRFFWIDDAFGSNVLRDEFVQDWTSTFSKVVAAILQGNRFVFTSRRHIYEAAKSKLGQKNLPVFSDRSAVVDVGDLSTSEKQQILYNHINFGNQTQTWKRSVKPYLHALTNVTEFLPGIAERLGDPNFTKSLGTTEHELMRFMQEPRGHLIDTINALDDTLRAGLIMIYVHQGSFSFDQSDSDASKAVAKLLAVPLPKVMERFKELKGSFITEAKHESKQKWVFSHPTISDALTEILKGQSFMMEALLHGAPVKTILSSFVCEGIYGFADAPTIPSHLNDVLAKRLIETEDDLSSNRHLFNFLASRSSMDLVSKTLQLNPSILERSSWSFYKAILDAKTIVCGKAHTLGLLPDAVRDQIAEQLENSAIDDFDLSFTEDASILGLIPPQRLFSLGVQIRSQAITELANRITSIEEEADLIEDPDSHFEIITQSLNVLDQFINLDEDTIALIKEARDSIEVSIEIITDKKTAKEQEEEDHSIEWEHMSGTNKVVPMSDRMKEDGPKISGNSRSVHDDLDL